MPLPVAHGLLGATIVAALHPQLARQHYSIPLLAGGVIANIVDFDFLLVFVLNSKTWHRGFSHSVVFGLLVSVVLGLLFGKQRLKETLAYSLAFTSHGITDYVTSKEGGGVQLLWPFSMSRLKLGLWGLSEVPSGLTSWEIVEALAVEFVLFTPPLLAVVLARRIWSKA